MHPVLVHYRALYAAARRQVEALAAGDVDLFHTILGEREALLGLIESAGLPSDRRERERAAAVLRQLIRLDEANAAALHGILDLAQQELNAMRGGQRVMQTYRPAMGREARFIDQGG